jgi:hypothetical protein
VVGRGTTEQPNVHPSQDKSNRVVDSGVHIGMLSHTEQSLQIPLCSPQHLFFFCGSIIFSWDPQAFSFSHIGLHAICNRGHRPQTTHHHKNHHKFERLAMGRAPLSNPAYTLPHKTIRVVGSDIHLVKYCVSFCICNVVASA